LGSLAENQDLLAENPNFGNIEKGEFFYALQIGIRPEAGKVAEGNNASTRVGFSIEMGVDGFVVCKNDGIRPYLGRADSEIIELDTQSISTIFEGLVITVSFGKLAAIIGNKKSRAMADPAWNLLKLVSS
jgi:hypothetical protein